MNNIEMIFGAPGCGKTTYLINLLRDLFKKFAPDEVAFVSFTKKGSYEGRDRAMAEFNYSEKDFPYFRTIHSLAFRNLQVSKYDMISKKNYKDFSRAMGMNFLGYYTEDLVNNDDKYLSQISLKKNNPQKAATTIPEIDYRKLTFVENNYERYKKEICILDYDDLILQFNKHNSPLPVKIAIIDEAQDLTSLQWEFCNIAFKNCETVYIAGDDDQAIYEWSGADVAYFLNLTHGNKPIILDKSYRLRENILNYVKEISKQISNRVDKDFHPVNKEGGIFFYNDLNDVILNSEESYYFLSRNNYFLSSFKEYLMQKGVLFYHKGEPSINKNLYNAIKKYEHLRKEDPGLITQDTYLMGLVKKNKNVTDPWYDTFEMGLGESNYYRNIFKYKPDINKININVSTIHGVKGGEADNVVLKLDITKNVFNNMSTNLDAELRCLYVGLTRARKNLHIIYANSKFGYKL